MNKEFILSEIRRTAKENGGKPFGWRKFLSETGIRESDWLGKHWARWSDALHEAGFSPNRLTTAYDQSELIEKYIGLVRKLGRLPTNNDLRFEARQNSSFPHDATFARLGSKASLILKILDYCQHRDGYSDVATLCVAYTPRTPIDNAPQPSNVEIGFVYLIKSGKFYKLGRSNAVGRREREIALQLPEKAETVHVIRTDDPIGIEAYWHGRFELKRKNGEWFDLSASEISAFKRRKFM